jgi:hypothetical protein
MSLYRAARMGGKTKTDSNFWPQRMSIPHKLGRRKVDEILQCPMHLSDAASFKRLKRRGTGDISFTGYSWRLEEAKDPKARMTQAGLTSSQRKRRKLQLSKQALESLNRRSLVGLATS